MITHLLLRIEHTKTIPDLLDLAAGRVYTLQGVSDVTAGLVEDEPVAAPVAYLWQHGDSGRTRIVMPDDIFTASSSWFVVGPLVLAQPKEIQK